MHLQRPSLLHTRSFNVWGGGWSHHVPQNISYPVTNNSNETYLNTNKVDITISENKIVWTQPEEDGVGSVKLIKRLPK